MYKHEANYDIYNETLELASTEEPRFKTDISFTHNRKLVNVNIRTTVDSQAVWISTVLNRKQTKELSKFLDQHHKKGKKKKK
jgi:hypothetical protein